MSVNVFIYIYMFMGVNKTISPINLQNPFEKMCGHFKEGFPYTESIPFWSHIKGNVTSSYGKFGKSCYNTIVYFRKSHPSMRTGMVDAKFVSNFLWAI